jgi:uncharacterized protein YuzE
LVASDVFTLEIALRVKGGMKLKVDQKADALYLSLTDTPASRSEEVSPGIIVDYDDQDRGVGVEMLYLSKRAPGTDVHRLLFEFIPRRAKP